MIFDDDDWPKWRAQAKCRDVSPRVFFPTFGQTYDDARAICAACPVQSECLEWAMGLERGCGLAERHGMYGGLTPTERYKFRKRTVTCEICGTVFASKRATARVCPDGSCWDIHRSEYHKAWRAAKAAELA